MKNQWACCCLAILLAFSVGAEELDESQSDEEVVLESESVHSQELQQQKDQLFGLLAQVDERYGDVSASLKALQKQITQSNSALDSIRKEIDANQQEIDSLNAELSGKSRPLMRWVSKTN